MAKRGRPKKTVEKKVKKEKQVVALATIPPVKEDLTEAAINKAFDLLGIGAKLDPQARALFVEIAKLHHLNPLKREIHAVTIQGKLVPVVGYEVYIQRARDTGLLQYWRVEESGEGKDYKATLIIKRRDWAQEFKWTARYIEVKHDSPTGKGMWENRPTFMTQKVAISQGFRLCFGDELGGMPYTVEEMTNGAPPEPELVKPEEKQTATTAVAVELVVEKTEIEKARESLALLYKELGKSGKFNAFELNHKKEQALKAREDLKQLTDYHAEWTNELTVRTTT